MVVGVENLTHFHQYKMHQPHHPHQYLCKQHQHLYQKPQPSPVTEDETKKKAKVKAKKVNKKSKSSGTTKLATAKPATSGLKGIGTKQGVNTTTSSSSGGTYG